MGATIVPVREAARLVIRPPENVWILAETRGAAPCRDQCRQKQQESRRSSGHHCEKRARARSAAERKRPSG
jgi:hypothetical protein